MSLCLILKIIFQYKYQLLLTVSTFDCIFYWLKRSILECLSKRANQKLLTISNMSCSRSTLVIYIGKLSLNRAREHKKRDRN